MNSDNKNIDLKHCKVCGRHKGVNTYTSTNSKELVPLCDKHFRALRGLQPITLPKLPGRNEPCPCQSGKKFKKCCLDKVNQPLRDKLVELGKKQMKAKEAVK